MELKKSLRQLVQWLTEKTESQGLNGELPCGHCNLPLLLTCIISSCARMLDSKSLAPRPPFPCTYPHKKPQSSLSLCLLHQCLTNHSASSLAEGQGLLQLVILTLCPRGPWGLLQLHPIPELPHLIKTSSVYWGSTCLERKPVLDPIFHSPSPNPESWGIHDTEFV